MAKFTDIMQNLIMSNPKRAIWFMTSMKPDFWEKQGENLALKTFHEAAEKVPAYRDFLKKHEIQDHTKIKTIDDFKKYVPLTTKENYTNQYSLQERSKPSSSFPFIFSTSGGTTGKPLLQSHFQKEFDPSSIKIYLEYLLDFSEKKVLYINAFALGTWYASIVATLFSIEIGKNSKYQLSVALCGLSPETIVGLLEETGKFYDFVIISTYPSFFRLIIQEGDKRKLNWEDYKIIPLCAGEPLTWNFKNFLSEKLHINLISEIIDMYSASETGIMAISTPFSNLFQKIFLNNSSKFKQHFSVFQYIPLLVYIEEINNELIITRNFEFCQLPIIRYRIKDRGEVKKFNEIEKNIEIEELKENRFSKKPIKWPFVFLKGRTDQAVICLGANIYPEQVKIAIDSLGENFINNFKIGIEEKENNPHFVVYLETLPGISFKNQNKIIKKYHDVILNTLLNDIDFKDAYQKSPQFVDPLIKIFTFRQGPFGEENKKVKPKNLF
ncbi:MAG TPA: hypothetical protein PLY02_02860 [Candidatus Pacearchaeota archaeon]|nr:hypothetical protein [Candidatus Pacearchaeota archaeon]HOK94445.1 hypothetical protein [Candidatus Pacearchaeota archaeon]